jgi:hypothetical protein
MKKILLSILLVFSLGTTALFILPATTYATDSIKVTVTEKVPGANCTAKRDGDGEVIVNLYECNLES